MLPEGPTIVSCENRDVMRQNNRLVTAEIKSDISRKWRSCVPITTWLVIGGWARHRCLYSCGRQWFSCMGQSSRRRRRYLIWHIHFSGANRNDHQRPCQWCCMRVCGTSELPFRAQDHTDKSLMMVTNITRRPTNTRHDPRRRFMSVRYRNLITRIKDRIGHPVIRLSRTGSCQVHLFDEATLLNSSFQ